MPKYTIEPIYGFGDHVCMLADPDKLLHVVIGYSIDRKDIMYEVRGDNGMYALYDFEIMPYDARLGVLN